MRPDEEAAQSDYGQVANQLRDNEGTEHRRRKIAAKPEHTKKQECANHWLPSKQDWLDGQAKNEKDAQGWEEHAVEQ
jgi:hypothetical protein